MNDLIYPRERTLGTITLALGLMAWFALIVGTFGSALIALLMGFELYLFVQSTLIAYIRGNGVELSETQFPDLYTQFTECCDQLQMAEKPQAYILNGNGGLNAFATKFLGTQYVVLLTDVVDAMDKHDDGVRFYMGHELGHLRMKHISGHFMRWPVLWLPLLGAAYSRARESTCDRHGLACCQSPEGAARALAALAAGTKRWQQLDVTAYVKQTHYTSGFWMSFHELTAGYPWLTKRAARVMDTEMSMPRRNAFSYLFAAFIPYAGRLGAGFGVLMLIYIIGTLSAVGIPAYQQYTTLTELNTTITSSQNVRDALGNYYLNNQKIPESLGVVGFQPELSDGSIMSLANDMILTISTQKGELIFTPSVNALGEIVWDCTNGEGLNSEQLPPSCVRVKIQKK